MRMSGQSAFLRKCSIFFIVIIIFREWFGGPRQSIMKKGILRFLENVIFLVVSGDCVPFWID
jgi:hypothetical protein